MNDPMKHWQKHSEIVALVVTVLAVGLAIYAAIDLYLMLR